MIVDGRSERTLSDSLSITKHLIYIDGTFMTLLEILAC